MLRRRRPRFFKQAVGGIFPVFTVSPRPWRCRPRALVAVGVAAALVPAGRPRVRIVEGLRAIG
jgi:putative ABC transport system permease protein